VTLPGNSTFSDTRKAAILAVAAAPVAKPTTAKSTAGMDSQGRVMDSSKVEAGSGQMVGDLNRQGVDSVLFWQRAPPLRDGLQGPYPSDFFAGGSIGEYTGGNLIWIIHCANETGYR
jgi:hypothetical protein